VSSFNRAICRVVEQNAFLDALWTEPWGCEPPSVNIYTSGAGEAFPGLSRASWLAPPNDSPPR